MKMPGMSYGQRNKEYYARPDARRMNRVVARIRPLRHSHASHPSPHSTGPLIECLAPIPSPDTPQSDDCPPT